MPDDSEKRLYRKQPAAMSSTHLDLEAARSFLANLQELSTNLREDIEAVAGDVTLQVNRRQYVRSLLAWVEAENHVRRQLSLLLADAAHFSIAEIACLQEESYSLDEHGKCQTRNAFGRLLGSTRFAFAALSKATGGVFEPNYGTEGWSAFRKAVDMRHRLTHPKSADELKISDEEVTVLSTAVGWFVESSRAANASAVTALETLNVAGRKPNS